MVVAAALLLASVAAAPSKPHLLFVLVGACAPPPAACPRDRSPTLSALPRPQPAPDRNPALSGRACR